MDKLEHLVRNKRQEFDHAEPPEDHVERFLMKLQEFHHPRKKPAYLNNIWRVAAVVLIIIAASFTINYFNLIPRSVMKGTAASELPPELKDVEVYYTTLTGEKLQQIESLTTSKEEAERIRKQALSEVDELESSNLQLQQEYVASGKNERVMDAIVNNYRIITSLLDHIINELSSGKDIVNSENPSS
ncbi:MAG: hypothetical protein PHD61_03575 [Bacteroidales bacterium]|nr:hypothetical protein [Lentimicrobiaceae bacterium]MDD5694366.1 hypothetical protein [Bacteroidales bacterium]